MAEKQPAPSSAPRAQGQTRFGPRMALLAGFAALLTLMSIMWFDSVRTLREIEHSSSHIRRDFLARERALEQIRSELYESGNLVRDYVLAESVQNRPKIRAELESMRERMDKRLKTTSASLDPEERPVFQQLATELDEYWDAVEPIFQWGEKKKDKQAYSFLRGDVSSQHTTVLKIANEISALNEAELKKGEKRTAEVFENFGDRLQTITSVFLGLGVIVVAATLAYTARLEKKAEESYRESLQAQAELKDLSTRLVDTQEQERRAISRELHDEVGQSLSALLMDVENLSAMPGGDGLFQQRLRNIKTLAEKCVAEVRNMSLLLRPSMLDDLGLVAALEWQAREISKRTGMAVDVVDENVSESLPEGHKTCVYRVVQEALNNCSRHAQAKTAKVLVRQEPGRLLLTIEDDGKGFDPRRERGLGLMGMTERVSSLGGVLKVDSKPGRGTCLRINLPLTEAPGGRDKTT